MRIWDILPSKLCKNHLLGEHRELHAIWNIITLNKKGYSFHPETKRWKGHLKALYLRHEKLVKEMLKRGYLHKSPLDKRKATGSIKQNTYVDLPNKQKEILLKKGCGCQV